MNEEVIKKMAQLSELELSESEVSKLAGELNKILEYMDQLTKVNCDKLNLSLHNDSKQREDQIIKYESEDLLSLSKDLTASLYKVPSSI